MRASSRYDAANSRWAAVEAAFTKCRDPSSQVRTDAKPGVKPPPCDAAVTTGDPQRCSISLRTAGGRCAHSSRRAVRPCGIGLGMAALTAPSSPTPAAGGEPDGGQAPGAVWHTASTLLPSGSRTNAP